MNLKKTPQSLKTSLILRFALSYLFCSAVSSAFGSFGIVILPVCVGLLVNLYFVDSTRFRIISLSCALLSLVVDALLCGFKVIYLPFAVAITFVVVICLAFDVEKSETSFYVSLIFFVAILLNAYLHISASIGDTSISLVFDEVKLRIGFIRQSVEEVYSGLLNSAAAYNELDKNEILSLFIDSFDLLVNLLPAIIAILAFFLAGLTLKYTRRSLINTFKREPLIVLWRFRMTRLYAAFFITLAVLNLFVSSDNVVGLSIMNLYLVFKIVFAYCGVKTVFRLLVNRFGMILAFVFVALGFFFLSFTVLDIFAFYAAIGTFVKFKILPDRPNKNN